MSKIFFSAMRFIFDLISLTASVCFSFQSKLFWDFTFTLDIEGLSGSDICARLRRNFIR